MKLTINKLNEEKIEFVIEDKGSVIFQNIIFYTYMDKVMFDNNQIDEMIEHIKTLYDGITEIKNNFSL